jgi:predicted enzyme related to lactoylglutathione lyase
MEVILYVEDMQSQVIFYRQVIGLEIDQPDGLADYSAVDREFFLN